MLKISIIYSIILLAICSSCAPKKKSSSPKKAAVPKVSELFIARKAFVKDLLLPMKNQIETTINLQRDYSKQENAINRLTDKSAYELESIRKNFLKDYGKEGIELKTTLESYKQEMSLLKSDITTIQESLEKKYLNFQGLRESTLSCFGTYNSKRDALQAKIKTSENSFNKSQKSLERKMKKAESVAKKQIKDAGGFSRPPLIIISIKYSEYLNKLSQSLSQNKRTPVFKGKRNAKKRLGKILRAFHAAEKDLIALHTKSRKVNKSLNREKDNLSRFLNSCYRKEKQLEELKDDFEKKTNQLRKKTNEFHSIEELISKLIESKKEFYSKYDEYRIVSSKLKEGINVDLQSKFSHFKSSEAITITRYSSQYLEIYKKIKNWITNDGIIGEATIGLIEEINQLGNNSKELQKIKSGILNILQVANKNKEAYTFISSRSERYIASWLSNASGIDINLSSNGKFKIKMPKLKIPKLTLPNFNLGNARIKLPAITTPKFDLNLELELDSIKFVNVKVDNFDIKAIEDLDLSDFELSGIKFEVPEIPVISEFITKLGQMGESFIQDISSIQIDIPEAEFVRIEANVEKDLKAPEDILKNSLNQVDDAKKDLDRELTNAYQNLKNTLDKANEDIKREREKGLKKVGAALEAAGQPKNLARIALVYTASVYGGPMGSALANSLLDKMENPGMSDKDLFNSFVVGAAAGYAAQGATSANVNIVKSMPNATSAIARNLTTDLGNVILKGENYSTEQFLSSLATGAINSNVGDDFLSEIVDSGINNAATYTINTTIYKQDFDEEAFEKALYEGMANGLARETVHDLMDKYVLPPAEERGKRFDERIFDALSDLIFAQALSVQEYIAQKQLEKYNELSMDEKKEVMEELAQIKEEFYSEYLPSVIKAQNLEYLDPESELVQQLYNSYLSHSIDQKVLEGSVFSKLELTTSEKKEIVRYPAFVGTISKAGFFALSFYGSYLTTEEVFRLKSSFEDYKKENKTKSMLDFYNEHPEEFKDLTTDVAISLVFPAFKGVKGLAKLGTKGAFKAIDSAQKLGIKPKNLTNAYKEVGKVSNGVKKQAIERASKFRGNWGKGNLNESIERLVGKNPNISTTPSGKIIYKGDNGVQVVHDYHGKYFRVENTSLVGKRRYLDLDGNVPNNKVLPDGRIVGSSKSEYEAATHFSME